MRLLFFLEPVKYVGGCPPTIIPDHSQNFLTAHGSRARRGGQVCVQGRRIPTWRGHQRVTIWRGHRVVPALRHGSVELIPRSVPKPRPSACPAVGVRVVSPFSTSARRVCSVWRAPVCRVWGVGFAAQAGGIAPGITRPRRARARGRFLVRTGPLPARAAPPRSVARRRARRLAGRWERGMGDPAAARTEGGRLGTRGIGVGAGRERARPLLAAGRTRHALIPHAPHARRARKCCRSRCPACFSASWRCWRSARRVPFRLPP